MVEIRRGHDTGQLSMEEGRYVELLQRNFDEYGKTYSSKVLGVNKITTMDPVNVEAILKTH